MTQTVELIKHLGNGNAINNLTPIEKVKTMADFNNHSGDKVGAVISVVLGIFAYVSFEQLQGALTILAPIVGIIAGFYSMYKNYKRK
jgi:hypothetical protein